MARERILIVDDHETNREILRLILEDRYELAEAEDGDEALAIAPSFGPSLILLDIMMPGIDGYETCRRLREVPEIKSSKIVMVSAKAMASERLQGYDAGADDYITKPFAEDELLAKVNVYMRLRQAEEVAAMKADVVHLLNHELWTPLASIKAPIELLLEDDLPSPRDREMLLTMIASSVDRLESLFRKSLLMCSLLGGTLELHREGVSLSDLAKRGLAELSGKYQGRRLAFDTDFAADAEVVADPERLEFVVATILDNAARFSPVGGTIRVRVERAGDTACLVVEDQGEGIPACFLPRVFEPLASPDASRHGGGHGLSLAIARGLARAHGGDLEIRSDAGRGTLVTLSFPCTQPSAV